MQIQINDQYRITTDAYNVIVQEKSVVKEGEHAGEERWSNAGYFPTLSRAAEWLLNHEVLNYVGSDVEQLEKTLTKLQEDLKTTFAGVSV